MLPNYIKNNSEFLNNIKQSENHLHNCKRNISNFVKDNIDLSYNESMEKGLKELHDNLDKAYSDIRQLLKNTVSHSLNGDVQKEYFKYSRKYFKRENDSNYMM